MSAPDGFHGWRFVLTALAVLVVAVGTGLLGAYMYVGAP